MLPSPQGYDWAKKSYNERLPPLYVKWRQFETSLTHCAVPIICAYVFFLFTQENTINSNQPLL